MLIQYIKTGSLLNKNAPDDVRSNKQTLSLQIIQTSQNQAASELCMNEINIKSLGEITKANQLRAVQGLCDP